MWHVAARAVSRIGAALAALMLVIACTIVLSRAVPGTFTSDLALDPALAPESVAAAEARANAANNATWLTNEWRGDLGRSLSSGHTVTHLVARRAVNTLVLTVPATLLAWLVVAAHIAYRTRVTVAGKAVRDWTLAVVQGIPEVVIGLGLVRLALTTGWLPVGGDGDVTSLPLAELVLERARHAALPVVGLGLTLAPALVRAVEAVLGPSDHDVVLVAARARGVSERMLRWRHQVRRAVPAIAPIVGMSAASLLGSAVVFETVFAWPGLGALVVDAVAARDLPVVLGAAAASALLLVVANAAADVVSYLADPRGRE